MRQFWRTKHIGLSAENTDPPSVRASSFKSGTLRGEDILQTGALIE
jgi:hypothetical protein